MTRKRRLKETMIVDPYIDEANEILWGIVKDIQSYPPQDFDLKCDDPYIAAILEDTGVQALVDAGYSNSEANDILDAFLAEHFYNKPSFNEAKGSYKRRSRRIEGVTPDINMRESEDVDIQVDDPEDSGEILTEEDELIDHVPANELKDMIKSAGGSLDGSESDDELRGMYKMIAANESFKRRAARVASAKKVKAEGGLTQGNVGGMKIELILQFPKGDIRVDGDAVCEDIVEAITADDFGSIRVPDGTDIDIDSVTFTELPRTMFEAKEPKHDDLPKYTNKSSKQPTDAGPYVKVTEESGDTWYSYDQLRDANKVYKAIMKDPDDGVLYVSYGIITTSPNQRATISDEYFFDKKDDKSTTESKIPKSKFVRK